MFTLLDLLFVTFTLKLEHQFYEICREVVIILLSLMILFQVQTIMTILIVHNDINQLEKAISNIMKSNKYNVVKIPLRYQT